MKSYCHTYICCVSGCLPYKSYNHYEFKKITNFSAFFTKENDCLHWLGVENVTYFFLSLLFFTPSGVLLRCNSKVYMVETKHYTIQDI
jgi:hypothetical protein